MKDFPGTYRAFRVGILNIFADICLSVFRPLTILAFLNDCLLYELTLWYESRECGNAFQNKIRRICLRQNELSCAESLAGIVF